MSVESSSSTKPTMTHAAYDMLLKILSTKSENPSSTTGELHWNACKREVLRCVNHNFDLRG